MAQQRPRRVAVIGAGPAGLSIADQLLSVPSSSSSSSTPPFSITLFDRRKGFGGVWEYDPNPGPCVIRYDASGRPYSLWSGARKDGSDQGRWRPPGAMYDGLRTNLPCDIMTYREHPYQPSTSLFPDRGTVEQYIEEFGKNVLAKGKDTGALDLRLGVAVNDVRRAHFDSVEAKEKIGWGSKWTVKSISVESGESREEEYDHVVLASGRCNTPTIPAIPGLRNFKRQILHSAWWRSPLPLEGKTVLVVGNSSSGSDIARELAGYILRTLPEGAEATKEYITRCDEEGVHGRVLHSYENVDKPPPLDYDPREEDSPVWSKRITVVPRIKCVDESGRVVFDDGSMREDIDVIIFGTGYAYDFPYLDQKAAPFDTRPLIPTAKTSSTTTTTERSKEASNQASQNKNSNGGEGELYTPPNPTSAYLSNLDDWSLFYQPDASICVLGAPIRIVPMPLTHVQGRIVAAAWAGHLNPYPDSSALPKLDKDIPSTDPTKWTSRAAADQQEGELENKTSDLGYPSDSAYQDALLSLLPDSLRISGKDGVVKVPQRGEGAKENAFEGKSEDLGVSWETRPVVATDEGWARMPDFRNERRQDTKRLRRLLLGY